MKHSPSHILDRVYSRQPSDRIIARVHERIYAAQMRKSHYRGYGYGVLALGALGALIPACSSAYVQATNSGLYEYVSLIVSDSGYALQHVKTVVIPILESIPMLSTALILGALLIMSYAISRSVVYLTSSHTLVAHA